MEVVTNKELKRACARSQSDEQVNAYFRIDITKLEFINVEFEDSVFVSNIWHYAPDSLSWSQVCNIVAAEL